MSRHHIDFVALDGAREGNRRAAVDDPLAEQLDHLLDVALVEFELLGDLQAGEVQAHEVGAEDPGAQRLVVAGEDGAGEVVEPPAAGLAEVALAMRLGVVAAVLDDLGGPAVGAVHAAGPTERPDRVVTPGIIDQVAEVDHGPGLNWCVVAVVGSGARPGL